MGCWQCRSMDDWLWNGFGKIVEGPVGGTVG